MKYKRILILGSPGSGKTTLSLTLRDILKYDVYHLDKYFRVRDEKEIDYDYVRGKMREFVSGDTWIIEGNYMKTLDIRLKRADFIIFMDLPTEICLKQAKERFEATKGQQRFDAPLNLIDYELDYSFMEYIANFKKEYRDYLYEESIVKTKLPHVVLKSHLDIAIFTKEVTVSWH